MDRRNLPLTALRSFEAVGRHLSFSRAAEALGVTHGAVSRQIASLEALLGVKLFDRGATLALTEDGHRLFAGVAPAFDRLAAAIEGLERGDALRVLAVNAPPTFTMKWLIPRLSAFQRRHSDVDVRLSTGIGPLRELKMNEVDVVIRRLERPENDIRSTPFLSTALLAVCAPELLERVPISTPLDVARHQLIEAETGALGWAGWFAAAGCAVPANARFTRFEHMFFALEAALDGLGVALMPSALVVDDLAAGRLAIAWNVPGVYERDYYHVLSPLSRQAAIAKSFAAWLSKEGAESNKLGKSVIENGTTSVSAAVSFTPGR
jgi:LysR family transcriptional regulator, glycine cleavage system transcriptional activator